jgi:NADPH2:quinone reductase
MKAILLRRPGGLSALEYVDVPTPRPDKGEVLVKADTIGVNMPEVLVRKGVYAWMPPPCPQFPGLKSLERLSSRARKPLSPPSGKPSLSAPAIWRCVLDVAEYIAVPAHAAHPLPPGCSLEAAACLV